MHDHPPTHLIFHVQYLLLLSLFFSFSALSQEIDELNEQCKGANAELQSEASLMFTRLAAASKLIDGENIDCVRVMGDREWRIVNKEVEEDGKKGSRIMMVMRSID